MLRNKPSPATSCRQNQWDECQTGDLLFFGQRPRQSLARGTLPERWEIYTLFGTSQNKQYRRSGYRLLRYSAPRYQQNREQDRDSGNHGRKTTPVVLRAKINRKWTDETFCRKVDRHIGVDAILPLFLIVAGTSASKGTSSDRLQLSFKPYDLKLKHAFNLAKSSRTHTPDVQVQLRFGEWTGYGEASMRPYLGETQESVCRFLGQLDLKQFTILSA